MMKLNKIKRSDVVASDLFNANSMIVFCDSPSEIQIRFVGATIGRPPELWFNHKFDICFLYEKSLIVSMKFW